MSTKGRRPVSESEKRRRKTEGARLQKLREDARVTQEDAGKLLGILGNQLSRKERGTAPFTTAEVSKLEPFYRQMGILAAAEDVQPSEPSSPVTRSETKAPPSGRGGETGAGVRGEDRDALRQTPGYWLATLEIATNDVTDVTELQIQIASIQEHLNRMQLRAAEQLVRANTALRDLVQYTVPVPVTSRTDLTPAQLERLGQTQAALAGVETATRPKNADDAATHEPPVPPGSRRPHRRAGGSGG